MQYGHWVTCAAATAISCLVLVGGSEARDLASRARLVSAVLQIACTARAPAICPACGIRTCLWRLIDIVTVQARNFWHEVTLW